MKTDYISFKSKSENNYFYSYSKNQILLLHPIITFILQLSKKKVKLLNWLSQENFEIPGIGKFSKEEILYYYKKYLFFHKHGYFKKMQSNNTYRYKGDDIKYCLANTSQVSFEVTDSCNLRCDYCIYGSYYINRDKPLNINLDVMTAKNVLNNLVELWNTSLNSSDRKMISIGFYGGEALLNMDFIVEIVNYSKTLQKRHFYFSFHITTNGVLLDKYISFFVENDFRLTISLDGGEELNNIYRKFPNQQPAFKVIYGNILEIKETYPLYFKNNIEFVSVLHNSNTISEIYDFFKSTLEKVPLTINLDTDSLNPDLEKDFWKMKNRNLIDEGNNTQIEKDHFVGVVEDVTNFIFTYSGYVKMNYLNLINDNVNKVKLPTGTCEPFSRKIFITARGKILPCERIGHQYQLGFTNESEISLDYDKIANQYNEYFDNIGQQCKNCHLESSCSVCMFKQHAESKDIHCDEFMDEIKIVNLFSESLSYLEQNNEIYSKILNKINYI